MVLILLLLLVLFFVLAYFRAPLRIWSLAWLIASGSISYLTCGPTTQTLGLVAGSLILVGIINFTPLRLNLLSRPLFIIFKRMLPPLSDTEREALESGTVGWDGELFSGRPDWHELFSLPVLSLTEAEQDFLEGPVEELCRMLDDWQIVAQDKDLPPAVWQFLKEQRFFGMIIPLQYGGHGFSALAHSAVIMKISSRSITAAVTAMVPNSLGPAELLLQYGTEAQKDFYLPRLARGEEVPCFALTGPEAGSDAAAMPDRGIVCRGDFAGEEIIGIRLNWEKRYITLGPVATLLGLAFKLSDPDHLLGDKEELGITLALIPTDTQGITIGSRHDPLGIPFQNGPNWGKDVFIPLDWIIGGTERAGQGWRMLMESLGVGRSISLPALSTGAGKLACRATGGYARIRRQFRVPIGRMEGVEEALTRIAGLTYQMEAARVLTCAAVDRGEKPTVLSAIVKYNLTERMRKVINDAMDVQGGSGICLGPRNYLARAYQSIPIGITVEGANILTRTLIIFGQGAIRSHPYVLKEMQAVSNPDPGVGLRQFDQSFFAHFGFTISTAVRALWSGLTGGLLLKVPDDPCRRQLQKTTRLSSAFVLTADTAMLILGGTLKRKEKLSGRLADILSNLYLISAVVKQFADRGHPVEEKPLVDWACAESFRAIDTAFLGFFRNFPNRPIAWLLRLATFPLGIRASAPSDQLGHQVAKLLMEPGATRDRLTHGIFVPLELNEPLGRIEDALPKVIAAEAAEKKIRQGYNRGELPRQNEPNLAAATAAGIISAAEQELIIAAEAARREVIRVDDFPQEA
ncbi:acyl-CoA dehydrogenase [Geopsychrobacter electrodiphilus]|uniref:acyl-CoA dehydrogenase n=1 Tax=Geopsychrobacter electrodiphilus TaxID=225196 RepID=UPI000370A8F3|nr:acyl-CoA dehydrogenase [Geopsychrobacter electrodiphilus]